MRHLSSVSRHSSSALPAHTTTAGRLLTRLTHTTETWAPIAATGIAAGRLNPDVGPEVDPGVVPVIAIVDEGTDRAHDRSLRSDDPVTGTIVAMTIGTITGVGIVTETKAIFKDPQDQDRGLDFQPICRTFGRTGDQRGRGSERWE